MYSLCKAGPAAAVYALLSIPLADAVTRRAGDALDPATDEAALFWHRLLTWLWLSVQLAMLFGVIAYVGFASAVTWWELALLALSLGIVTGGIGITCAHELCTSTTAQSEGLARC